FDIDAAQPADRELTIHHVVHARDDLDLAIRCLTYIDDLRNLLPSSRRECEDDLMDPELLDDLRDIMPVAHDGDAGQIQILFLHVIIDVRDWIVFGAFASKLPRDDIAG